MATKENAHSSLGAASSKNRILQRQKPDMNIPKPAPPQPPVEEPVEPLPTPPAPAVTQTLSVPQPEPQQTVPQNTAAFSAPPQPPAQPAPAVTPQRSAAAGRKRKARIRYDRIIAALVLLLLIIFLPIFIFHRCNADKEPAEPKETKPVTTTVTTAAPITLKLIPDDVFRGDLQLINENHAYTFDPDDIALETVYANRNSCYGVSDMEVSLDAEVIDQFNRLMQAYTNEADHQDIIVVSGYRTKNRQAELYEEKKTMLPGGFSDYHSGRLFDLSVSDGSNYSYYAPTGSYLWIAEHASEYGFVVRYPDGKTEQTGINPREYTYRYVGLPHSQYMYEHGLCLEEYVTQLHNYSSSKPLTIETGDVTWSVFYIQANMQGETLATIPSGVKYTVSGDNAGGLIVAYQTKPYIHDSTETETTEEVEETEEETDTEETEVEEAETEAEIVEE